MFACPDRRMERLSTLESEWYWICLPFPFFCPLTGISFHFNRSVWKQFRKLYIYHHRVMRKVWEFRQEVWTRVIGLKMVAWFFKAKEKVNVFLNMSEESRETPNSTFRQCEWREKYVETSPNLIQRRVCMELSSFPSSFLLWECEIVWPLSFFFSNSRATINKNRFLRALPKQRRPKW